MMDTLTTILPPPVQSQSRVDVDVSKTSLCHDFSKILSQTATEPLQSTANTMQDRPRLPPISNDNQSFFNCVHSSPVPCIPSFSFACLPGNFVHKEATRVEPLLKNVLGFNDNGSSMKNRSFSNQYSIPIPLVDAEDPRQFNAAKLPNAYPPRSYDHYAFRKETVLPTDLPGSASDNYPTKYWSFCSRYSIAIPLSGVDDYRSFNAARLPNAYLPRSSDFCDRILPRLLSCLCASTRVESCTEVPAVPSSDELTECRSFCSRYSILVPPDLNDSMPFTIAILRAICVSSPLRNDLKSNDNVRLMPYRTKEKLYSILCEHTMDKDLSNLGDSVDSSDSLPFHPAATISDKRHERLRNQPHLPPSSAYIIEDKAKAMFKLCLQYVSKHGPVWDEYFKLIEQDCEAQFLAVADITKNEIEVFSALSRESKLEYYENWFTKEEQVAQDANLQGRGERNTAARSPYFESAEHSSETRDSKQVKIVHLPQAPNDEAVDCHLPELEEENRSNISYKDGPRPNKFRTLRQKNKDRDFFGHYFVQLPTVSQLSLLSNPVTEDRTSHQGVSPLYLAWKLKCDGIHTVIPNELDIIVRALIPIAQVDSSEVQSKNVPTTEHVEHLEMKYMPREQSVPDAKVEEYAEFARMIRTTAKHIESLEIETYPLTLAKPEVKRQQRSRRKVSLAKAAELFDTHPFPIRQPRSSPPLDELMQKNSKNFSTQKTMTKTCLLAPGSSNGSPNSDFESSLTTAPEIQETSDGSDSKAFKVRISLPFNEPKPRDTTTFSIQKTTKPSASALCCLDCSETLGSEKLLEYGPPSVPQCKPIKEERRPKTSIFLHNLRSNLSAVVRHNNKIRNSSEISIPALPEPKNLDRISPVPEAKVIKRKHVEFEDSSVMDSSSAQDVYVASLCSIETDYSKEFGYSLVNADRIKDIRDTEDATDIKGTEAKKSLRRRLSSSFSRSAGESLSKRVGGKIRRVRTKVGSLRHRSKIECYWLESDNEISRVETVAASLCPSSIKDKSFSGFDRRKIANLF